MLTRRVAVRFATSTTQQQTRIYTRLPLRFATQSIRESQPSVASTWRSYATPSKPKKGSIGESSVKRPRKTQAQKDEEAQAKAATKATAKEAAALKRSTETKVAKQAKAEAAAALKKQKAKLKLETAKALKKQKAKERAAAKKAKAKPKAKQPKVLSEEQQARLKVRQDRLHLKELKAAALRPPPNPKLTAWLIFHGEKSKGSLTTQGGLTEVARQNAAAFKELSAAEREHYNHLANEKMTERRTQYESFVKEHSPAQILAANTARSKLRKLPGSARWESIRDDRLVDRPVGPYSRFFGERVVSGDFKAIDKTETGRLISSEWKALADSEKQRYEDGYAREKAQYYKDFATTYGHEAYSAPRGTSPAVTA